MRKAGEIFKKRQQDYSQSRQNSRQSYQDQRKKTKLAQLKQRKEARASGASREELQTMRKEHRTQRQNSRNEYRQGRRGQAQKHRSNMQRGRDFYQSFGKAEGGFRRKQKGGGNQPIYGDGGGERTYNPSRPNFKAPNNLDPNSYN